MSTPDRGQNLSEKPEIYDLFPVSKIASNNFLSPTTREEVVLIRAENGDLLDFIIEAGHQTKASRGLQQSFYETGALGTYKVLRKESEFRGGQLPRISGIVIATYLDDEFDIEKNSQYLESKTPRIEVFPDWVKKRMEKFNNLLTEEPEFSIELRKIINKLNQNQATTFISGVLDVYYIFKTSLELHNIQGLDKK